MQLFQSLHDTANSRSLPTEIHLTRIWLLTGSDCEVAGIVYYVHFISTSLPTMSRTETNSKSRLQSFKDNTATAKSLPAQTRHPSSKSNGSKLSPQEAEKVSLPFSS